MRFSLLVIACFGIAPALNAEESTDLRSFLSKVWQKQSKSYFLERGDAPLLSSTELRVTAKEEQLDEVSLHLTPYAWGERGKLQELSGLERRLTATSLRAGEAVKLREIWLSVLALRQIQSEEPALKQILGTCDRILESIQANPTLLAQKPDDYLDVLAERQAFDQRMQEARVRKANLNASLAAAIDSSNLSLDLSSLADSRSIQSQVTSWSEKDVNSDLRRKELLATRANLEIQLESIQRRQIVNFFDIGTALDAKGESRALELKVGIEIPLGDSLEKAHELQRKKIESDAEIQATRLQNQREAAILKARIIDTTLRLSSSDFKKFESAMDKAHKEIRRTYGSENIAALKSQLILEKYRLGKAEIETLLYQDYLELSYILGQLKPDGSPLLLSGKATKP